MKLFEPATDGGVRRDGGSDGALMARSLAYLFAAGAGLALVSVVVGSPVSVTPNLIPPVQAACALLTAGLVALLLFGGRFLRHWAYALILACGTALISVAIGISGEATSAYVMFYVLVTLYACYFFSRLGAALEVAFIALAYGLVLLAGPQEGGIPVARWLITVGTLAAAAALIMALKESVDRLICRLADAARTDVLTGLHNRRGFQELFDNELERARRTSRPMSLLIGDIDHFKELNDRFGHSEGDRALERVALVLRTAKRRMDVAARIGGEEFALIVPETGEHEAYIAAERLRRAVREAFEDAPAQVTISFGVASFPQHGAGAESLLQAGDQALYAAKELGRDRTVIHNPEIASALGTAASRRQAQREGYLATVLALAEALDQRDTGTARHSQTVGRYAELIARELELPDETVERLRIGGVLHDVGKIGVPDSILRKPGPLTHGDWQEMRRHPEIAARILEASSAHDIREWVLAHHERPDGQGYPLGLSGDDIPIEAQVLAVADAFEAMTSDRVYRMALPFDDAVDELRRVSGTQFDARVVDAFLKVVDRLGSEVASAR